MPVIKVPCKYCKLKSTIWSRFKIYHSKYEGSFELEIISEKTLNERFSVWRSIQDPEELKEAIEEGRIVYFCGRYYSKKRAMLNTYYVRDTITGETEKVSLIKLYKILDGTSGYFSKLKKIDKGETVSDGDHLIWKRGRPFVR